MKTLTPGVARVLKRVDVGSGRSMTVKQAVLRTAPEKQRAMHCRGT